MRIALLAPPHTSEAGGGFTYVSMIYEAVSNFKFGAEIIILDFKAIDYFPEASLPIEPDGPDVWLATVNRRFTRSLNYHIRLHKIDLLWLVTPSTTMVPCVPFIVTVWDLAHRFYPFFPEVSTDGWSWQEREDYFRTLLPRASFILTGTARGAAEIATCYGIPAERIRIVPLPAPRSRSCDLPTDRMVKARYLFYPAQFWPHKNHVRAVRALSLIRGEEATQDLELVFCGSDQANEGYIRKMVQDEGLTDSVHFLGFVERAVIETLYRDAEALLYLSFLGPDNLPPLEALDFGCPVILSDHPGHREQLADAAIYVDPLDEGAVARGVAMLRPELRAQLAACGRTIVESRRIEAYLTAVGQLFAEFAAYQACWPAPSSV